MDFLACFSKARVWSAEERARDKRDSSRLYFARESRVNGPKSMYTLSSIPSRCETSRITRKYPRVATKFLCIESKIEIRNLMEPIPMQLLWLSMRSDEFDICLATKMLCGEELCLKNYEGKSVKLKLTIFVTNIEIFKDKLNIHVFVFFNF